MKRPIVYKRQECPVCHERGLTRTITTGGMSGSSGWSGDGKEPEPDPYREMTSYSSWICDRCNISFEVHHTWCKMRPTIPARTYLLSGHNSGTSGRSGSCGSSGSSGSLINVEAKSRSLHTVKELNPRLWDQVRLYFYWFFNRDGQTFDEYLNSPVTWSYDIESFYNDYEITELDEQQEQQPDELK